MNTESTAIRVLIVEDDEDDFILTSRLLSTSLSPVFNIDWAPTPQRAREQFRQNCHDLCLMDYHLGEESGLNLVREAQTLGFDGPIIMLTGQDDTEVEIAAAQAGAVDYLTKHKLGREQLSRAIRYALARREVQREHNERVQAELSNKAKTEFLATLSHEIRTPLTAIIGFTELLLLQHRNKDSDLGEKLGIIRRNGEHLLSLLNDTLDLSKIEAGKLEIESGPILLMDFARDVVLLVRDMVAVKNLEFGFEAQDDLPLWIESDAMRLRQVLLNLLSNAIKFTAQGKVSLSIRRETDDDGCKVVFEVRDTGIGIQPQQLRTIFDPFMQVPAGPTSGSGLGLTISQKLAQKLGGGITVSSVAGEGSVFTLRIDAGRPSAPGLTEGAIPEPAPDAGHEVASHFSGRVLVVDDMEDVRSLITGLLRDANVDVIAVAEGEAALRLLQEQGQAIAAVFMDLNMPGMDGYQTLRCMRENNHLQPVIALTAAGLLGERERCLQAGFTGFLTKPMTQQAMMNVLGKLPVLTEALPRLVQQVTGESDSGRDAEDSQPDRATACDVLVIEDHADANEALCRLLELLGYRTVAALRADHALTLYRQHDPANVIIDVNLGQQSGLELLEQLRLLPRGKAPQRSRFYLVSGDERLRAGAMPVNIDGSLIKPVTLEVLQRHFPDRGRMNPLP